MLAKKSTPEWRIKHSLPTDDPVRTLSDAELVDKCVQGFKRLRELIPYLREARRRWAQPGRHVPVPGRPCWTEWITQNLHDSPRRVQQLLNEPSEIPSQGQKASRKLGKGDWRALLKLTEKEMAKVFGPLESGERFAEAVQQFAQALADRFGERHGRVKVSVAVTSRRKQNARSKPYRRSLAEKSRDLPSNRDFTLLPILALPQDCGGCGEMHFGIAKFISENGGTDEQVAQACGVSLAIVQQARVRHMLLLREAQGNGHGQ